MKDVPVIQQASDEAAALSEARSSSGKPVPTDKLSDRENVIFDEIIATRPLQAWKGYRLRLATHLAQYTVMLEDIVSDLRKDGYTSINRHGEEVSRPQVILHEKFHSKVSSLTKQLGMPMMTDRGAMGVKQSSEVKSEEKKRQHFEELVTRLAEGGKKDHSKLLS